MTSVKQLQGAKFNDTHAFIFSKRRDPNEKLTNLHEACCCDYETWGLGIGDRTVVSGEWGGREEGLYRYCVVDKHDMIKCLQYVPSCVSLGY